MFDCPMWGLMFRGSEPLHHCELCVILLFPLVAPGPPTVSFNQTKTRTQVSKKLAAKLEDLSSSNGVTGDDIPEEKSLSKPSERVTVETLSDAVSRCVCQTPIS